MLHKLLFASLAVAIVVSWAVAFRTRGDSAEAHPHSELGREGLDVCFSLAPDAEIDVATFAKDLESALEAVVHDPRSRALDLHTYPRSVTHGCPDGYVAPPAGLANDWASWPVRGVVGEARRESTLIFVAGRRDAAVIGTLGFGRSPYEAVCEGETCYETSSALFLDGASLGTTDFLYNALVVGLGVDPIGGRYPNGHPDGWEFTPK